MLRKLPFGLTESQAEAILRLCSSNDFKAYEVYLSSFGAVSMLFLRKRNQSAEDQGFYKGQLQMIEDMMSFPVELARILRREEPEADELPSLEE